MAPAVRPTRIRLGVALTAGMLLACPDDPAETVLLDDRCIPADGIAAPSVTLGSAAAATFTPLAPGTRLGLELGVQGGQHVVVAARLAFSGASPWFLDLTVRDGDARVGGVVRLIDPCPTGAIELPTLLVFLDEPRSIDPAVLVAELRPSETAGVAATARADVAIAR